MEKGVGEAASCMAEGSVELGRCSAFLEVCLVTSGGSGGDGVSACQQHRESRRSVSLSGKRRSDGLLPCCDMSGQPSQVSSCSYKPAQRHIEIAVITN